MPLPYIEFMNRIDDMLPDELRSELKGHAMALQNARSGGDGSMAGYAAGPAQQIRIEALRAAAVVVGPSWAVLVESTLGGREGTGDTPEAATLRIAKQFAAYLESGE